LGQTGATAANNKHAVYLTARKESLTHHYERKPQDPRISHDITLKMDNYGNVTDSVSIGYRGGWFPPIWPSRES